MCTVSMVGDHYRDMWRPNPWYSSVTPNGLDSYVFVSKREFDELKRQVDEMKALLTRAKEYDARTGQADCEMDEKVDVLRRVARLVGVDLDEVLVPRGDKAAP